MALVELSVVEQRYHVVIEVCRGRRSLTWRVGMGCRVSRCIPGCAAMRRAAWRGWRIVRIGPRRIQCRRRRQWRR